MLREDRAKENIPIVVMMAIAEFEFKALSSRLLIGIRNRISALETGSGITRCLLIF
jgi:hypothetical protein